LSYKIIWKYLGNYKKETYRTIVLSLLLAGLGALIPAIYGYMFDLIVRGERGAQLFILLGVWLLAKLVSNVLTCFVSKRQFLIAENCEKDYVVGINAHILELPMEFHEKENSGEILEKISRGGANLGNIIREVIFSTSSHILTALIVLTVVFFLDYRLGIAILVIMAAFIFEVFRNADSIAKSEKELNKEYGNMYGTFGDSIDNVKSIKSFTAKGYEGEKFDRGYGSIMIKYNSLVDMWARVQMNQSNIMDVGFIAVMGISIFLVMQETLSAGQMIMVIGYTNVIYQPLTRLSDYYIRTQRGMVSIKEGENLYNKQGERYDDELRPVIDGNIEFKHVSFSYDGKDGETLTGLNIEIKSGQTVALVGESGAGKSTFIEIISRFYEPKNGGVYLDGANISKINLSWLRQNVAIVPQKVVLFNGTILDNIRFGRRDASDEEVIEAAKAANAHEFIKRLPQKYKQKIGKWGVMLSGGEAQRIAIARAILKNARILILDEATSSLDSGTEKLIKEAIDNLRKEKDKTIIIIAHRFSTIEGADVILVFKKGEIIEQGTHKDLMNKGGEYKRLCDSQSF